MQIVDGLRKRVWKWERGFERGRGLVVGSKGQVVVVVVVAVAVHSWWKVERVTLANERSRW